MSAKTLLFADDSATMRTIMEKTFYAEDIDVQTVPSGEAAIAKAKEIVPSIIIADAGMTGVNGYDVCEAVRSEPSLSQVPVIIMSGISNPYDDIRGRNAKATEHIKKPFDTTKLIEKVNELMSAAPKAIPATPPAAAPKPPVAPSKPSPSATLHAFPTPSAPVGEAKTPMAPPMPSPSTGEKKATSTMEFARPNLGSAPSATKPAPEPIELKEETTAEPDFQVGTLAELAQMDESGGTVKQEQRDDAIELDEPHYEAPAAPSAPTPAPSPAVPDISQKVSEESAAAASAVVAQVDGLSSEQAEAILKLTKDVVEKVVWEVVPDLAETIIKEQIEKLLKE